MQISMQYSKKWLLLIDLFIKCPLFLFFIALQIDGKIVTMKKVKEIQPDFLSKIEKSRPPSDHFDSEILDKIVSNENFMDKLREASKLMFNGASEGKLVIKDKMFTFLTKQTTFLT